MGTLILYLLSLAPFARAFNFRTSCCQNAVDALVVAVAVRVEAVVVRVVAVVVRVAAAVVLQRGTSFPW